MRAEGYTVIDRPPRVDRFLFSSYTLVSTSGSSSVVECFLAKEDVAGSTPVSRSNQRLALQFCSNQVGTFGRCLCGPDLGEARYPSGKGEVCKTFMRRFDPDPRLHNPQ